MAVAASGQGGALVRVNPAQSDSQVGRARYRVRPLATHEGIADRRARGVRSFVADMSTIILRGGVEIGNPLEIALEFLAAYPDREPHGSGPASFDESDLRLA